MAIVIGEAGASARRIWAIDRFLPILGLALVPFVLAPTLFYFLPRVSTGGAVVGIIVGGAIAVYFQRRGLGEMLDAARGASNWKKGADGEARTAVALRELPDEYIVFHDFHPVEADKVAKWNVDHVIIGPNGVFVVETKNYARPNVAPATKSPNTSANVKQARRNAMGFKDKLRLWSANKLADIFVVPLLVYVQDGAYVQQPRERDVHVIPLKWLASEVSRYNGRRKLDPDEIYRIAHVMFHQMPPYMMDAYRAELDRFGAQSRQFKLDRAAARVQPDERAAASSPSSPRGPSSSDANSAAPESPTPSQTPTLCPKCGGHLVQRRANKGPRKGGLFLGCENFRSKDCHFIYNLDAKA